MRGPKRVKGTAATKRNAPVEPDAEESRDFQHVTALARGLTVLEACARAPGSVSTGDLATSTGFSQPNVSRIAYTLVQAEYLEFNPRDRTYVIGRGAEALAATIRRRTDIHTVSRMEMEVLARSTGFNVGLGTMAGNHMIYLDAFEGASPVGLKMQSGYQVSLATSAMGRAYLAALGSEEREQLLAAIRDDYGAEWPSLERSIASSITQVEETGYCVSLGDWNRNVNAIASPLRDPNSRILYVLVLGGPSNMLTEQMLDDVARPFLTMVQSLKMRLNI